ncbi:hypothetical protein K1T71_015094 [Dendrolimus kikuchii]|nr:hypothetical protein K1T71_015094 [Dendrolimus kikuchii]
MYPPPQVAPPPPFDFDALQRAIITSVGNLVDARLAVIEDRLLPAKVLRPPLAGDKKKKGGTNPPPRVVRHPITSDTEAMTVDAGTDGEVIPPPPKAGPSRPPPKKAAVAGPSRTGTKEFPALRTPRSQISGFAPQESSAPPTDNEWTVVGAGKKGKGKGKGAGRGPNTSAPPQSTQPKPVPPKGRTKGGRPGGRHAAGPRAKGVVDIVVLGLKKGLTVLRAANDARLLQFPPGPENAQLADRVAELLRGALAGVAEIYRPVKRGEST